MELRLLSPGECFAIARLLRARNNISREGCLAYLYFVIANLPQVGEAISVLIMQSNDPLQ